VTIALRVDPEDQNVDPGREAVFTIHVVNQSGVVDRVALDILGSAAAWSTTDPQAVALFPGTDATATLVITPPLGTPLGSVPLGIRATAETSGFVEVGEANLNVGASRTVEAELRPRTATGKRRATSVVVLHNLGNAPTKIQVVATDPDDAIVFDAPSGVQIGPGMTEEVPLRMRLPSREKQGATLPYQVIVEGGDTGQSLDGQVRQPPKKRWPLLAAMAVIGLLAMAFLMFKPQDSVAIKDGKADEPTTVPAAAATTAVGAPAGAAPGAADPVAAAAAAAAAGGPAPAAPGGAPAGAATTAKAAPVTTATTLPPAGAPVITRAPTTVAPRCPGVKGTPQQTAQKIECSWEAGTLTSEVTAGTLTDTARNELLKRSPLSGQVVGSPTLARDGLTDVPFSGCKDGDTRGVRTLRVDSKGVVVTAVLCSPPPTTASLIAPSG
jgi:hypothetical protein